MKRLEIKPQDQAKVAEYQKRKQAEVKIEPEQLLIAEFGFIYGWEAVKAVLNDEISSEEFTWLLAAGRKMLKKRTYENSKASFIGAASAKSRNPNQTFTKATKEMRKNMEADV